MTTERRTGAARLLETTRPTFVTDTVEMEMTFSIEEYRAAMGAGFGLMDFLTSVIERIPQVSERYEVIRANGWKRTAGTADTDQVGTVTFRGMQRA